MIVIDNIDEDTHHIVMADDGRGATIYLPSLFISKLDGEILKEFLSNNTHVLVNIPLSISNSDNWVNYDLYYGSILELD